MFLNYTYYKNEENVKKKFLQSYAKKYSFNIIKMRHLSFRLYLFYNSTQLPCEFASRSKYCTNIYSSNAMLPKYHFANLDISIEQNTLRIENTYLEATYDIKKSKTNREMYKIQMDLKYMENTLSYLNKWKFKF